MAAVYKTVSKSSKSKAKSKAAAAASTDDDATATATAAYRQRLLILSSRGVTYRHRHLLQDLHALLPHSRKDAKLDTKTHLATLNELADLHNCNTVLFLEARKAADLYLWLARPPNGPTLKCHLQNPHTMRELHFPGNCLRGSRPVLSFDAGFDAEPHWRLVKELLALAFAVPKTARRAKPFVDHVMGFSLADGRVWVRCYEIKETAAAVGGAVGAGAGGRIPEADTVPAVDEGGADANGRGRGVGERGVSLIEIGPRFVLTPIVVLEGSFGGPVIYENPGFVSPNRARAAARAARAGRHAAREERKDEGRSRRRDLGLNTGEGEREVDELDDRVLFA